MDITCIRAWQGWRYLTVFTVLFPFKVAGSAVGLAIPRERSLNLRTSAVTQRRLRGTIIQVEKDV
jgi:hypothetical protein